MTFKIILVNNPESTKEPIQLYGGVSLLLPVRRDNHNRPRSAVLSGREKAGHQPGLALLVQIDPYLCLFLPLAALIQVFSLVGQRLGYIGLHSVHNQDGAAVPLLQGRLREAQSSPSPPPYSPGNPPRPPRRPRRRGDL